MRVATRKKHALLIGEPGLLSDAILRVLAKENWQAEQADAENWQQPLALHNAEAVVVWLGSEVAREDVPQLTAYVTDIVMQAGAAQSQHVYVVASPATGEDAAAFTLVERQVLALHGNGAAEARVRPAAQSATSAQAQQEQAQELCPVTVVVLPTIYGPALDWQGDGEALAAALPANALHEDDAAYALLQLLTRGTAATRVVIDGTDAALQQELGWRPHYTLATGVQRVWPQIRARRVAAQQAAVTHNAGAHWLVLARRAVPYVENIAGALLLQRVAILQGGTPVSNGIAFDMNFLYIGTMGLVYGQRQAFIAMVLAMTLLVHGWLGTGHDIVGLLYEPVALLHLTTYLFIACLTGYFADRRRQEKQAASWAADEAQERYRELAHFYDEALHTKDAFYRQIVNTDDSIGRLYSIIRRLDTVDLENVFDQAASVTAEVLSVHDIIIYIPDRAGDYLRSKVRLGALTRDLPRSLRRTEQGWLQLVCQEQQIFVNRDLLQDVPDLAAPVVYEGQVVAVYGRVWPAFRSVEPVPAEPALRDDAPHRLVAGARTAVRRRAGGAPLRRGHASVAGGGLR